MRAPEYADVWLGFVVGFAFGVLLTVVAWAAFDG